MFFGNYVSAAFRELFSAAVENRKRIGVAGQRRQRYNRCSVSFFGLGDNFCCWLGASRKETIDSHDREKDDVNDDNDDDNDDGNDDVVVDVVAFVVVRLRNGSRCRKISRSCFLFFAGLNLKP